MKRPGCSVRRLCRVVPLCCAFLCAILAPAAPALAQSWPSRPVKLIVPTGPGAATDVMARLLADGLSRGLGQPIVVENMPGASGIVAHQSVARAAPDGYTLLFTNTSGMAINPVSFKQLPYDPTRDFTPVAMVCSLGPQMLSVNARAAGHHASGIRRLRQRQSRQALDRVRYHSGGGGFRRQAHQQAR
jgi:tripartite-type tricarboxylate transporter receptor subunit TctC